MSGKALPPVVPLTNRHRHHSHHPPDIHHAASRTAWRHGTFTSPALLWNT